MSTSAVIHRTDAGLVELTGEQRIWFLQNTVTADVEGREPGSWTGSFFLTPKGKVIAHFRVGVLEDRVWLDVEPPATDQLVDWCVRYRFRTKVEVADRTTERFTVIGPPAAELVGDHRVVEGEGYVAFGAMLGDVPIADVHASQLPPSLEGVEEADEELFEMLRIEAGVPRFGVDYDQDNLPQESGLVSEVPVDKGCYVGQETVARIHFRGHVNKVVRTLSFSQPVQVGSELHADGERVGVVTSAAHSPDRGPIGLGMVRVSVPEGTSLEAGSARAVVGPVPVGTKTS